MTAAKHLDPIVGVDMHLVQLPAPGPPVMLPVPYVGYLLDPADYSGGCTTHINGLPRARAGTPGMGMPPHIAPGGVFIKPPSDECEMEQGSSTVVIDGDAASAMGHPVLSCHDVGSPTPVRSWKKSPAKSMMTSASLVLPIPGMPVMIGGSPTTSASASASSEEPEEEDPVLETVELQVWNGIEMSLANERFELHLPNGDIEDGTLDVSGVATVRDVPAGHCVLVFPDVDAPPASRARVAVDPPLTSGKIVQQVESGAEVRVSVQRLGESFRQIALDHGVVNWRAEYLHASNQALRNVRPNPDLLQPGDELCMRLPETPVITYRSAGVAVPTGVRVVVHVGMPQRFRFSM